MCREPSRLSCASTVCLRALQASTTGASAAWISFAALANAVGGTARQIAWLGVLVIGPMHGVVAAPAKAGRDSRNDFSRHGYRDRCRFAAMVFPAATYQPRAFHIPSRSARRFGCCSTSFAGLSLGVSFLVLPVSLAFILALRQSGRRAIAIAVVLLLACVGKGVQLYFFHALTPWSTPPFFTTGGNVISAAGISKDAPSIWRAARVVEPARRYRHDSFCARSPNLGGLGDWLWKSQTIPRPQAEGDFRGEACSSSCYHSCRPICSC